jgi:hypothetical protein
MHLKLGLLAIIGVVSIGVLSASAAPASHAVTPPTAVRVVVTTYHYRLSRSFVPRGRVVFTVINRSNATIDFKIDKYATPKLRPGKRYVLPTLLTRRGRYVYFASGQFAEMGLTGELTVR